MINQKSIGHSSMLIINIFFGVNMAISKDLLDGTISPMGLNAIRFLFGAIAFWGLSAFYKERVSNKDLTILLLGSIFGLLANQIFFIQGLTRTSPIDASIICTSVPILTMIFSAIILREPITWIKALGVCIGAGGAVYLVYTAQYESGGSSSLIGNLLCFGSCVSYSLFLVITKPISMKYHPITTMKWMFLFANILFLPFCIKELQEISISNFSSGHIASLSFVLVCATLIPYLLIPVGQKILRPTTLAMYNYVQPIVASILAVFIGQDSFTFTKGVATALVFTGVYIVTRSKSRADLEAEKKVASEGM